MLNLEELKNQTIYLIPHSPLSLNLAKHLAKNSIQITGFIDNNPEKNQSENNIFHPTQLTQNPDKILILSPNHGIKIYQQLIKTFPKSILELISYQKGIYTKQTKVKATYTPTCLPKDYKGIRNLWVFISKEMVTSNNKALYLSCIKNNIPAILLTDNKSQLAELQSYQLNHAELYTTQADQAIAEAKYIIFDQGNYHDLPKLTPDQQTIQLWHGVGLKKMSKLIDKEYDYFISTSDWVNETNFKNIFNAKKFLATGYPRNDYLKKQKLEELDYLFVDKTLAKTLENHPYLKVILYAPTHRENMPQLNLSQLNNFLKEHNYLLITKAHHFYYRLYAQEKQQNLSNIYQTPSETDIYPLLNKIDILISDYSSLVYDYLLLNKPIIYLAPDLNTYNQTSPLLFDFTSYSPGKICNTQEELQQAILQANSHNQEIDKAHKILKLFHNKEDTNSAVRLINYLLNEENDPGK